MRSHPLSTPIIQEESPRHIGQVGDFDISQVANLSLGQVTNVLGEMDGELTDIISLGEAFQKLNPHRLSEDALP